MDNKPVFDPEKRIEGIWCYDSETGEQVLMDRKTNKEVARKDKDGNIKWKEAPNAEISPTAPPPKL